MQPRGPMQGMQVLLPVWGDAYLRQCLDVCIPSLLAPGNVPALAAALPTSFVLVTRERDLPRVRAHPAWRALAAVCDARLDSIDPLLSEASSMVLTLVYLRAIRALGAAALDTGLVFLVADFVVADGALRHVLERLQSGVDALLAGNFRLARTAAQPLLASFGVPDSVALRIPPRALVRFGLQWLHPASRACMPVCTHDGVVHDPKANRLFWPAGPGTLLGRFYLLHMVAIRPQTVDTSIAAPCDYSFVPQFCPTGRIETITDSDRYVVAELQPAVAEAQELRPGPLDSATLAGSLAEWVTAGHRRNAATRVIFHADEAGPDEIGAGATGLELDGAIRASDRFVAEIERRLGPAARPLRPHPYWPGMLDHHAASALQPVDRAALGRILGEGTEWAAPGGLRRRLLGRMPSPRPWHPHWADLRLAMTRLAALSPGRDLLIVSRLAGEVRAHLLGIARSAGATTVAHLEPEDLLARAAAGGPERYQAVLLVSHPIADTEALPALLRATGRIVTEDAPLLLALSDLSDGTARAIEPVGIARAAARVEPALEVARLHILRAPRWRIAVQAAMLARARAAARADTLPARLVHLAAGIACAGLSLAANLACWRSARQDDGGMGIRYLARRSPCSTALLDLRRAPSPQAAAPRKLPAMVDPWTA
jgi:hypothetical protein